MEKIYESRLLVFSNENINAYNSLNKQTISIGSMYGGKHHVECMLEYGRKYYIKTFDKINENIEFDKIIYIYTEILGDALFLNWSSDEYKAGIFCLPCKLGNKQRLFIENALKQMDDCHFVVYDNFNLDEKGNVIYRQQIDITNEDIIKSLNMVKGKNVYGKTIK